VVILTLADSKTGTASPKESEYLAFGHGTKLLCFTMEISSDPGLPETLKEELARRDEASGERQ